MLVHVYTIQIVLSFPEGKILIRKSCSLNPHIKPVAYLGLGPLTVERSFFAENELNDQERSHRSEKKRALHPGLTRVSNFISGYNHSAQKLSVFINYLKFKVPAANVHNRTTK